MNRQGNVLDVEQYTGAPIERAHLLRGFNSKKTPVKWIRFFRACVLQREIAETKKKKKLKKVWVAFFIFSAIAFIGPFIFLPLGILFPFIFVFLIVAALINYFTNKKFKNKFADGFDFFADYFSAFFTLIEEDLQPQSKISLQANLKNTVSKESFVNEEPYDSNTRGFISGKQNYYERVISKGSCFFNDGSLISFQFTEKIRERIVKKRGSVSGKRKTKYKFKSVYPFALKMKIPKSKYSLKPNISSELTQVVEENDFYVFKTIRKFDTKKERPDQYNPYNESSITTFAVDYFSLEVINLINTCYSCVTPRV
ncbi:hypothetical protein [Tenacibaculum jejuense]|uniref:Uncharacterized protein n=1 Tax=Tenacibaculum jejuense TaxID=584609 RepID=A0A238UD28_9FLAO|nr:hypothetical protein [Tenacibaculum jejuense]SNR16478.1 Probable transmembrane protein of unknown function [Tenacibaculum jejuense]